MNLPFFLAENQMTYVFLIVYFFCNILMVFSETFSKNWHFKLQSNIPYRKLFHYIVCVIGTCLTSLLFDLRFVLYAENIFIGICFAVLLVAFIVILVIFALWWPAKIGFKNNVYAQFASVFAISLMVSFVDASHTIQKAYVLRETIFIFLPLSMVLSGLLAHWTWKIVKN